MGGAPVMQPNPAAPAENSADVEHARRDELFGNRKSAGRQSTLLTQFLDSAPAAQLLKTTTGGQ